MSDFTTFSAYVLVNPTHYTLRVKRAEGCDGLNSLFQMVSEVEDLFGSFLEI